MRTTIRAAAVAVGVLALAGCGPDYGGSTAASTAGADSTTDTATDSAAVLATTDSALGEIVVDSWGRAVYVFDRDTADSGASACSGDCLATWPAVVADSADPAVDGVGGTIGTLTRDDGTRQVTLDGLPLYTYAADSQAGAVTGQGVQDVWWVVGPDGAKITAVASPAPALPGY